MEDRYSRHDSDWRFTSSSDECYTGYTSRIDHKNDLKPLIERLRQYDALRGRLQTEGGTKRDLARITRLLTTPIHLSEPHHDATAALNDPVALRRILARIGYYNVHLDVRQLDGGMPVYYLCRTVTDYWSEYSSVVEDLYVSPGYPMSDPRFVRLMYHGHETYFIRLSTFRGNLRDLLKVDERALDGFLIDLASYVFQAAWHEDQLAGVLVAQHLNLPCFQQALELLYLCLSGELCEIRSVVNQQVLEFFEVVYPQPAIYAFLQLLTTLDGAALNELPQEAIKLYGKLSRAFNRFLELEVAWGYQHLNVPLYKLVFGNFARLDSIGKALAADRCITEAGERLEVEAQAIIDRTVERCVATERHANRIPSVSNAGSDGAQKR